MRQLIGHVSPETAYVVEDYPYGFRLRCKIRYWIETSPKHGQRFVSQTTNPKREGEVWNKPKASTYSPIRVMFIDESTGHVENDGISPYADADQIHAFGHRYPELDEYQRKHLDDWLEAHARYAARKAAANP